MMKMNRKYMAAALSAVLLYTGFSTVQAFNIRTDAQESADTISDEITLSDNETVYALSTASGSVRKVMAAEETLQDLSANGTSGSSNVLVCNIDDETVNYHSNIEKDLPVEMKVTYTLDGKEISPENLAGKSGKVTITYSFTSLQKTEINGEEKFVPFAALSGLLLDSAKFENITVSNGKVLSDGSHTIIAGVAFPGLRENLDEASLPTSFTVQADVTDFSLTNTMTIVTNSVFNVDGLEDMDEEDLVDSIMDAVNSLIDGSSELYEGLETLLSSTGTLSSGVDSLYSGSVSLESGAEALDSGASSLQSGAYSLASGLNQLASNNAALLEGAQQIMAALVSTANTQLDESLQGTGVTIPELTTSNYNDVLNSLIDQMGAENVYNQAMQQATEKATEEVNANTEAITQQVTAAVQEQVTAQVEAQVTATVKENVTAAVLQQMGMSTDQYEQAVAAGLISEEQQAQVNAAVEAQMESDTVQAQINALTDQNVQAQMSSETVLAKIAETIEQTKQNLIQQAIYSDEVQKQVQAAVDEISASAAQVSALKGSLNNVQTFYNALVAYTNGVSSAAAGANTLASGTDSLKSGTSSLVSGAGQLCSGVAELKDGTTKLVEGVEQLDEGGKQLSDGILDGFGEVENLKGKLETVADIVSAYNDGFTKTIKFIYKTDEIK